MKPFFIGLFLLGVVILNTALKPSPTQSLNYRHLGDSLSLKAQQTLLSNLLGAIEKGGTAYAVDFCHENASPLTNSVSSQAKIQRVSARNRNPDNATTIFDKKILDVFEGNAPLKDTLVAIPKGYVYYKPIRIGMSTCLQCHGQPKKDIEAATAKTIQKKYRFDKATGYQMGQLRGAWKLTFLVDK
ncbi:DUF3365 domain-containing protein [Runella sp. MFBS21]|uniref:Tll0287-like domain-containing protein n=1 Tax=Runella sp. MFBS21 TaxID=3034018 RepID=UPI0023F86217|nr:DUF3365 domain-containing protein [Runella sp. MFBS21]MDF7818537.1 DUF3365 domain-containing protein [Runella sp. MFBS21]